MWIEIARRAPVWGLLLLVACVSGCRPEVEVQPPPPPTVSVEQPSVETVPVFLEENGLAEALAQAVVEARVGGILQEIHYQPGVRVDVDQLLFTIEPDDYQAAVTSAEANLAAANAAVTGAQADAKAAAAQVQGAEAQLAQAAADFERAERLLQSNSIPQSEFDLAEANKEIAAAAVAAANSAVNVANARIEDAQASVKKAQADLDQKNLELRRTKVEAPIAGRPSPWKVKQGNLVTPGTALVEIVDENQVWVNFSMNERLFLQLVEKVPESARQSNVREKNIPVLLQRNGDADFTFQGWLDNVESRFDSETGTIGMRAIFDNQDPQRPIKPGSFVRVRIEVGQIENAVLVSQRAVARDQIGSFVFVVDDQQRAQRRAIQTGPQYQGKIVIREGIQPADRVIVDGLQRIRPGAPVALAQ